MLSDNLSSSKLKERFVAVKTEDGHYTLYSNEFQEHCHSLSGAFQETMHFYVQGCQIEEILKRNDHCKILEIGTGSGTGYEATLSNYKIEHGNLDFVTVEKDKDLVDWLITCRTLDRNDVPGFCELKLFYSDNDVSFYHAKKNGVSLTLLQGDCRISLPKFLNQNSFSPDAIFQDPFSPQKNSALWSVEWFMFLKKISNSNTVMSTYSASSAVRKSMLEAAWKIQEINGIGRKKSGTKAVLSGDSDELLLDHLGRSPQLPILDSGLKT